MAHHVPDPSSYAKKFSGRYEHRLIKGGVGHNLPQEAPQAFAEAVVDVAENDRHFGAPGWTGSQVEQIEGGRAWH